MNTKGKGNLKFLFYSFCQKNKKKVHFLSSRLNKVPTKSELARYGTFPSSALLAMHMPKFKQIR